ncbi:MAG: polymer-forming cytoskeletal protein [Vicinamibacteria bacterium]|nr:polymer-forming cytoskeletal protein [Vicinamibacteria bacterium]
MPVDVKDNLTHAGACVLGEDATFTGRLEGRDVTILGRFKGTLQILGRVRIGRNARVEADVQAAMVEINGEFVGDVKTQSLVFGETARARGVFHAKRLGMKEGASVTGSFPPVESAVKENAAPFVAGRAMPAGKGLPKEALAPAETIAFQKPAPAAAPSDKVKPTDSESSKPSSSPAAMASASSNAAVVETQQPSETVASTLTQASSTETPQVVQNDNEKRPEASPPPPETPESQ